MYIKNLQADRKKAAADYYQMLDEIYLDHLDLGWKISQQMYQNIHLYLAGDTEQAVDQLKKISQFYQDLNVPHQSAYLEQICQDVGIQLKESAGTISNGS